MVEDPVPEVRGTQRTQRTGNPEELDNDMSVCDDALDPEITDEQAETCISIDSVMASRKNPTANCVYQICIEPEEPKEPEEPFAAESGLVVKVRVLKNGAEPSESEIASIKWLRDDLLPKLIKWSKNTKSKEKSSLEDNTSLRLLSIKQYADIFNRLKEKYSENLITVRWLLVRFLTVISIRGFLFFTRTGQNQRIRRSLSVKILELLRIYL